MKSALIVLAAVAAVSAAAALASPPALSENLCPGTGAIAILLRSHTYSPPNLTVTKTHGTSAGNSYVSCLYSSTGGRVLVISFSTPATTAELKDSEKNRPGAKPVNGVNAFTYTTEVPNPSNPTQMTALNGETDLFTGRYVVDVQAATPAVGAENIVRVVASLG
ncbi:MAG: hypothetical protein JO064_00590 [Actinobacteria bacterium]|nr:hypothetical protein [Actinomycetota bacterium]